VRRIKGAGFNDVLLHLTKYPPPSHLHPSGHSFASLACRITNHNQNNITGVANSNDINTTVRVVRIAACCNLQREREELILNVTVFVGRVCGEKYREKLILNVTVCVVRVWGGEYREELILNVTVFVVRVWGG